MKRKKYPRLPNGFPEVSANLGKGPPASLQSIPRQPKQTKKGNYIHKTVCYVDNWYVGFAVLNATGPGTV